MVDRTFNVSANDPEKQKRERQKHEAEQSRKVERIKDTQKKREINTMMNKRDNAHEVAKARDGEGIERRVDAELQKRVQPKPQKHLRPNGMGGDTRESQVKNIRERVTRDMGDSTEKRREADRSLKNRQIDRKINHALSGQSKGESLTEARARAKEARQDSGQEAKSRTIGKDKGLGY